MNKKVLKTMITLVVVFLVALYVLKIFFPEQFVMAVQNEQFIKIGDIIDNNVWLSKICSGITTFIGYFLITCASAGKWKLSKKELLIMVLVVIGTRLLYLYDINLANGITTIAMVVLPLLFGAKTKQLAITYGIHGVAQLLSLSIRSLPMMLTHINSIISIFMTIEGLFWLLLFYLYFNYNKESK